MILTKKIHNCFIISLLWWIPLSISAQITNQATLARVSEAEIQMQDKFMAGVSLQQIGKLEGASKLFEEVLSKNPKCDACAFYLARLYGNMGKPQEAMDNAKKAAALDPQNKWYKMALAEAYEKVGKDKEAAEVYKSLAEASPFGGDYNEEIYFRWVYSLVRTGEPAKAIKVLDDLEKKKGISEEISLKKQTIFEAMGDLKKASAELKKLADKYPQVIEYQRIASDYFAKMGDKTTAAELNQRILKLDPTDSKARLAATTSQKPVAGGDVAYLNSLKDLFKKTDIKIDDKIKTFLPYVNKIAEKRDPALAATGLELAQIIEQAHPNEAKSFSLVGDLLYQNGKPAEALEKYKKCTQINKSVYAVWEQMMYVQEELGRFDELLATSEKAVDLFPNQAVAFYFNGLANEKKGKLSESVSALEQVVMMSSKKPNLKQNALVELGVTHSKSKSYDKSDKAFDEALKLNSKSSIALLKYANALLLRGGMTEKAKQFADDALRNAGETDALVSELYGDYLFKTGDKDGAVKYWSKAKMQGAKSVGLERKIADKALVE